MHQQNISLLCDEADRLLTLTKNLTREMLSDSYCIIDEINDKSDFTTKGLNKILETLNNEESKLANKEMVIAIIGTMKAGKSTTINAIIGTEVLPNRNRPMTALPTLIRHKKGKHVPELFFDNLEPLTQLSIKIKSALNTINKEDIQGVDFDKDMDELVSQINNGSAFSQSRYEGADAIFDFLKGLNDIVRLSAALNIDFPFDAYATIEQIPIIEVEFAHLSEFESSDGQLSILDTPGPNEAGQPHLKKMLNDQLNKASAVLMVMDYTQLRSTSDAEVRDSVANISKSVPLYALVNKFDAKDRNGDDEEQIKKLVANDLMRERINYDDVFPVSSKWGYLANRARHEIKINGKLPDSRIAANAWVIDFAEEAIGRRWKQDDLEDNNFVLENAEPLWRDSLFSAPMTKVIQAAHGKAALYALNSASSQLGVYADKYQQYFNLRSQGIKVSIEKLQENVIQLKQDDESLSKAHDAVRETIKKNIDEVVATSKKNAVQLEKELEQAVNKYFEEGKKIEEQAYTKSNDKAKSNGKAKSNDFSLKGALKSLLGTSNNASPDQDFDPKRNKIEFDDISQAKNVLDNITKSTDNILSSGEQVLGSMLTLSLNTLEEKLNTSIADAIKPIENSIQGGLAKAGINIDIKFPQLTKRALHFSVDMIFDDAMINNTKTVTRSRRKTGMWGKFCSWFNTSSVGWENYQSTETSFIINIDDIKKIVNKQINEFLTSVLSVIEESISKPISLTTEAFFESFTNTLENIRASIFSSISVQQRNTDTQEKIKRTLNKLFKDSDAILSDSNSLENDVKKLLDSEVASV